MHRTLEVKMCGQRRYVISVVIHVMAATGLGGAAMAAPVVGYDAIAVLEEEQHLRVPVIRTQGPPMVEDDRLRVLRPPILVENLYAVFGGNCVHVKLSPARRGSQTLKCYGAMWQLDCTDHRRLERACGLLDHSMLFENLHGLVDWQSLDRVSVGSHRRRFEHRVVDCLSVAS